MKKRPPVAQIRRAAGLSFRGLKATAIAQSLSVSPTTVANWKKTKTWAEEVKEWEDLERRETFELAKESSDEFIAELVSLRRKILAGIQVQVDAANALGLAALAAIQKIQEDNSDPIEVQDAIQKTGCGYSLQTSGQVLKTAKELIDQNYAIGSLTEQFSESLKRAVAGDLSPTPIPLSEAFKPTND